MAEQHEINEIVKRIDNKLLEQMFERLGVVDLDEEWKKSTNRNIKPLCDALAKLPDSVQDEVGLTLEEIAKARNTEPADEIAAFYASDVYRNLERESTKYWWLSPAELCDLYLEEA